MQSNKNLLKIIFILLTAVEVSTWVDRYAWHRNTCRCTTRINTISSVCQGKDSFLEIFQEGDYRISVWVDILSFRKKWFSFFFLNNMWRWNLKKQSWAPVFKMCSFRHWKTSPYLTSLQCCQLRMYLFYFQIIFASINNIWSLQIESDILQFETEDDLHAQLHELMNDALAMFCHSGFQDKYGNTPIWQ